MFIFKAEYDAICDRANSSRHQLKEANQRIEELSASRTSAMAEVIYHRENNQLILAIIEGNSHGRTYEQKLDKIKELISKNGKRTD